MRSTAAPDLLAVRALAVGSVSLALAAAAHALAGGGTVWTGPAVAVLVASVLPAAVWVARRPLALPRLVPALVLLQVVLHAELSVLATHDGGPHAGAASAAALAAHAGHGVGDLSGTAGEAVASDASVVAIQSAGHGVPGLAMLVAHAVAVVVIALVLTSVDRAARWLLAWMSVVALLVRSVNGPAPVHRRRSLLVDGLVRARALARLACGGLRFRGPPSRACRAVAPVALGAATT